MTENELAEVPVEAAFRVHREVGPGLLEHAYVRCMHHELLEMGIATKLEHSVPLVYKGANMGAGYRLDLWLEDKLIVEAKTVEGILPIHRAQLMAYTIWSFKDGQRCDAIFDQGASKKSLHSHSYGTIFSGMDWTKRASRSAGF